MASKKSKKAEPKFDPFGPAKAVANNARAVANAVKKAATSKGTQSMMKGTQPNKPGQSMTKAMPSMKPQSYKYTPPASTGAGKYRPYKPTSMPSTGQGQYGPTYSGPKSKPVSAPKKKSPTKTNVSGGGKKKRPTF